MFTKEDQEFRATLTAEEISNARLISDYMLSRMACVYERVNCWSDFNTVDGGNHWFYFIEKIGGLDNLLARLALVGGFERYLKIMRVLVPDDFAKIDDSITA